MHPEDNDSGQTLQASCKQSRSRLSATCFESLIGLVWALLVLVSVVSLLANDRGVTDFRYVGF